MENKLFYQDLWEFYIKGQPKGGNKAKIPMIGNYDNATELNLLKLGLQGEDQDLLPLLNLFAGVNDIKISPRWRTSSGVSNIPPPLLLRMQYLLSSIDISGRRVTNYNAPTGDTDITSFYLNRKNKRNRNTINYDNDDVAIVDGGATKIINLSMLYLKEQCAGSDVILLGPSYFQFYLNAVGTVDTCNNILNMKTLVNSDVTDTGEGCIRVLPTLDEIKNTIDENTSAIIVTQPGNPSADFYAKEEIEEILKLCKKYNCLLIEDLSFEDLINPRYKDQFFTFADIAFPEVIENIISIRSFSKGRNARGRGIGLVSSKNNKFMKYVSNRTQSQIDSPSNINSDVINLDMMVRMIELEESNNQKDVSDIIATLKQDMVDYGINIDEKDAIMPINEKTFASYKARQEKYLGILDNTSQDLVAMFRAMETPFVALDKSGITGGSEMPAYFNRFVKLDNKFFNEKISFSELYKKIFIKTGAEIEWGPAYYDFSQADNIKKEQGLWMRLSLTGDSRYTQNLIQELKKGLMMK